MSMEIDFTYPRQLEDLKTLRSALRHFDRSMTKIMVVMSELGSSLQGVSSAFNELASLSFTPWSVKRYVHRFSEEITAMKDGLPFQTYNSHVHEDVVTPVRMLQKNLTGTKEAAKKRDKTFTKYRKVKKKVDALEHKYALQRRSLESCKSYPLMRLERDQRHNVYETEQTNFKSSFASLISNVGEVTTHVMRRYLELNAAYMASVIEALTRTDSCVSEIVTRTQTSLSTLSNINTNTNNANNNANSSNLEESCNGTCKHSDPMSHQMHAMRNKENNAFTNNIIDTVSDNSPTTTTTTHINNNNHNNNNNNNNVVCEVNNNRTNNIKTVKLQPTTVIPKQNITNRNNAAMCTNGKIVENENNFNAAIDNNMYNKQSTATNTVDVNTTLLANSALPLVEHDHTSPHELQSTLSCSSIHANPNALFDVSRSNFTSIWDAIQSNRSTSSSLTQHTIPGPMLIRTSIDSRNNDNNNNIRNNFIDNSNDYNNGENVNGYNRGIFNITNNSTELRGSNNLNRDARYDLFNNIGNNMNSNSNSNNRVSYNYYNNNNNNNNIYGNNDNDDNVLMESEH